MLISRTQTRLDNTKEEISQISPNIEVRTIEFDFTNSNLEDYQEKIFRRLRELDIGVLGKMQIVTILTYQIYSK